MRFGAAVCDLVVGKAMIGQQPDSSCQFSSPGEITVSNARGAHVFETGVGQKATVIVTGSGDVRCVLSSPYWNWDTGTREAHSRAPVGTVEHS
jgi:hypothetical protein